MLEKERKKDTKTSQLIFYLDGCPIRSEKEVVCMHRKNGCRGELPPFCVSCRCNAATELIR